MMRDSWAALTGYSLSTVSGPESWGDQKGCILSPFEKSSRSRHADEAAHWRAVAMWWTHFVVRGKYERLFSHIISHIGNRRRCCLLELRNEGVDKHTASNADHIHTVSIGREKHDSSLPGTRVKMLHDLPHSGMLPCRQGQLFLPIGDERRLTTHHQ